MYTSTLSPPLTQHYHKGAADTHSSNLRFINHCCWVARGKCGFKACQWICTWLMLWWSKPRPLDLGFNGLAPQSMAMIDSTNTYSSRMFAGASDCCRRSHTLSCPVELTAATSLCFRNITSFSVQLSAFSEEENNTTEQELPHIWMNGALGHDSALVRLCLYINHAPGAGSITQPVGQQSS